MILNTTEQPQQPKAYIDERWLEFRETVFPAGVNTDGEKAKEKVIHATFLTGAIAILALISEEKRADKVLVKCLILGIECTKEINKLK